MVLTTNEIWIGEDDNRRQLQGSELEAFIADREALRLQTEKQETEAKAKASSKVALLERLGITADEAALLLS
jgi:hypothetical protein